MMIQKKTQNNNELKQILTPEQYSKWEANQNKKMEKRDKMRSMHMRKDARGQMKAKS